MNKRLNNSKIELNLTDRIESLNLSKKIITALKRMDINTIEELVRKHEEYNLKKIRNIGPIGLKEVEKALIEKCNIRINKDISELQNLGLSTRALNILIQKCKVSTINEILEIPLDKKSYNYLDVTTNVGKEIVDKIHSIGLKFNCEIIPQGSEILKCHVGMLGHVDNLSSKLTCKTIEDILKLDLDPESDNSIYKIRGIGPKNIEKLVNLLHSKGFVFECEKNIVIKDDKQLSKKEKNTKELKVTDSINDLGYYPLLTRNMRCYGIKTIEDLLKLSTNEFVNYKERGLYNIRGFGKTRVLHLINYIHKLGFVFEDEKNKLEENISLENLYNTFDSDFIVNEFLEKIELPKDFEDNYFVLQFIKLVHAKCKNENNEKYTNKEIIIFLSKKLMEHKKKMLCITNTISKKLELKK